MRWKLALALALLFACGDDQDPEGAAIFWDQIQAADYRSWARAPGWEEPRSPSRAAHGDSVDIFVNDVVEGALATPGLREWPVGSVIVKDGYEGGDLCFVAGMEKRDDGWFWVEYNGDGDTLYSGEPTICTGCHTLGDDFVRGFFLPVQR